MPASTQEIGKVDSRKFGVPCCPELDTDKPCDVIDFNYRLIHRTTVTLGDRQQVIPVEVILHIRLERCPGDLALGDLVYSSTLLPGEKVRLFSMDRRTRFSFDSASSLSYRREQTSEERYYMSAMSDFMSDVTVRDEARATNTRRGSTETHAETSGFFETIFSGPSVDVRGSYDAESTSTFLREMSSHASASHNRSVSATRAASSVSVGEVQTRTHAEGETEDHFESASRVFSNPNRCHAITFFFYQINKTQKIKLTIERIRRRVIDPAADTRLTNNAFTTRGEVSVIPSAVLATDQERLAVERSGRASAKAGLDEAVRTTPGSGSAQVAVGTGLQLFQSNLVAVQSIEPLPAAARQQAVAQVDEDLRQANLLDAKGDVPKATKDAFELVIETSLPTPGLFVRGCLDDCDICEPALKREIAIELERKKLENDLLRRQIELLEKSQEYRCCPAGETDESDGSGGSDNDDDNGHNGPEGGR